MENKINIAKLLKNCPEGTKLYSTIFGNCTFKEIINTSNSEFIIVKTEKDEPRTFDAFGEYFVGFPNSECMLFPSKENRDWSKFQISFKDGDVVATTSGCWIGITEGGKNKNFMPTYCVIDNNDKFEAYFEKKEMWIFDRLATEEEKRKLFDAIKANGYCWNTETRTLERLIKPKFKIGDKITNGKTSIIISYIDNEYYYDVGRNIATRLFIKNQDDWELVEPKFKVGDRIRHRILNFTHRIMDIKDGHYIINEISLPHGLLPIKAQDHYELVPDKFDITTLKPFDRVLVRLTNNCVWTPKFFWYYDIDPKIKYYPFVTIENLGYPQCIPYNGNEHLCRTTNDCDDFYKTWKK